MNSSPQQPSISPCPACGGQRIGAPAYKAGIGRKQGKYAMLHVSSLKALVCMVCGQVTFYIENMENLKEELRKYPESFTY